MYNYNGHICDVCKEKFTHQSDVVVCPECGTPHHRECYKQLGHCVNEAKHAEGFEWTAPQMAFNPNVKSCPKCGHENPKDATFCENCGISLVVQSQKGHMMGQAPVIGDFMSQGKTNGMPPVMTAGLDGEHDGVSYKDMAIYMGPSHAYYVYNFKKINTNKKSRTFVLSAFLFDGLYFLYRKMWKEAIVVLLLSTIITLPSSFVLLETLGYIPSSSPLLFEGIDTVITICSVLTLAIKILLGFIAVPLYQKKVIRDLKRFKSQSNSNNEYYQKIVEKSGPCKAVLLFSAALMIAYLFI